MLFLFQGFTLSLRDLAQIGDLVEHVNFHASTYGDSFEIFLSKHYGELKEKHTRDNQEEKDEHEKLPFSHQCNIHNFIVFVHIPNDYFSSKVILGSNTSPIFFYSESYSSIRESEIFQPPRLA
ncbi:hypothetical protein APR41_08530 [Salegentibacter salinarum]|uniref:Uncharacterized protein n=2 Tax=Salegentibacter salinarum TaxID=447422 RepID=A0A2N0TNR7_9FLAO|nr:hypothetical protein APR41_08530 [Salegentibacter salinarum]SKB63450.1 hypothetical protein SAMN05660903_01739 [Salegentibacter salinarum]